MRRTFWMLVGAGLGAWMVLRLQRVATRLTPGGAVDGARRHLRHLRLDASAAVAEGRRAKQATELELRRTPRARPAIDAGARGRGQDRTRPALSSAGPAEEVPVRR